MNYCENEIKSIYKQISKVFIIRFSRQNFLLNYFKPLKMLMFNFCNFILSQY